MLNPNSEDSDWTSNFLLKDNVQSMLEDTTGLPNVNPVMAQIRGSLYLFSSQAKDGLQSANSNLGYYVFHIVTEDCYKIVYPVDVDEEALKQIVIKQIDQVRFMPLEIKGDKSEE
ncbi:hypothetical protein AX15_005092 [Amanita polypyramis BW_CC]|nr:hypothetical protein AX15_005092 [Amanita polypyramis BW_CC]